MRARESEHSPSSSPSPSSPPHLGLDPGQRPLLRPRGASDLLVLEEQPVLPALLSLSSRVAFTKTSRTAALYVQDVRSTTDAPVAACLRRPYPAHEPQHHHCRSATIFRLQLRRHAESSCRLQFRPRGGQHQISSPIRSTQHLHLRSLFPDLLLQLQSQDDTNVPRSQYSILRRSSQRTLAARTNGYRAEWICPFTSLNKRGCPHRVQYLILHPFACLSFAAHRRPSASSKREEEHRSVLISSFSFFVTIFISNIGVASNPQVSSSSSSGSHHLRQFSGSIPAATAAAESS